MSGREDAVSISFHHRLFSEAIKNKTVEMGIPTGGGDRWLNADSIFTRNELFFLVEFKSAKHNLKDESRKDSACNLCNQLSSPSEHVGYHDRGHFAAWGHRPTGEEIPTKIGIYRKMVCNSHTLPNCPAVNGITSQDDGVKDTKFIDELATGTYGLDDQEFIKYLQWLLNSGKGGGGGTANASIPQAVSNTEFPLDLFGVSFSATSHNLKLERHRFGTYAAFTAWATRVVSQRQHLLPPGPPAGNGGNGGNGGNRPGTNKGSKP